MASRPSKRPLAASTLSLFVCGLGQIYNRQSQLGLLFVLIEMLYIAGHWALIRTWPMARDVALLVGVSEAGVVLGVAAADLLMVVLLLVSVWQAYRRAEEEHAARFDGIASPMLSGTASLLLPGWGQLINAQPDKALFFLFVVLVAALAVASAVLTPVAGMVQSRLPVASPRHIGMGMIALAVSGALIWILSVYDAVVVAGFRRHADRE